MTQQAQAEALALHVLDEVIAKHANDSMEANACSIAKTHIERLHARVQKMEADLAAEAARTAEQKLRADQMSQQHDHQAAMNREAREQLAMAKSAISGLQKRKDDWKQRAKAAESQLEAKQAAVQMPEPAARTNRHYGEFYWDNHLASQESRFGAKLYTEQQVRALLAGVSAPAATADHLANVVQQVFDALQDKIDARGPISKGNLQHYVNLLREAFDASEPEPQAQADARDAAPAASEQDARVQWWLAELDRYGNPTLTDGAHMSRAGADKAAYLISAMGLGCGKKYAVARVDLSEPNPSADGVNHEAIAMHNRAANEAQQGGAA